LILIEAKFEVGGAHSASISRAPLNVKDSIGRAARDQSEYATARAISSQVSL